MPRARPIISSLNGNVNGRNLGVTGSDIPQAVHVPAIDLAMKPQQIQSNNFTATSGATTLAAQMTLSQYTGNSPNVDATLKTVNGKVNELLGIAKAYGVSAVEGMTGTGNISLDVHATGPIKNTDAMNFSGSGALAECVAEDAVAYPAGEHSKREHAVHAEFREPDQSGGVAGVHQRQRQSQHGQLPGAEADASLLRPTN